MPRSLDASKAFPAMCARRSTMRTRFPADAIRSANVAPVNPAPTTIQSATMTTQFQYPEPERMLLLCENHAASVDLLFMNKFTVDLPDLKNADTIVSMARSRDCFSAFSNKFGGITRLAMPRINFLDGSPRRFFCSNEP